MTEVFIPKAPETGKPKGFAFVYFTSAGVDSRMVGRTVKHTINGVDITIERAYPKGSGPGGAVIGGIGRGDFDRDRGGRGVMDPRDYRDRDGYRGRGIDRDFRDRDRDFRDRDRDRGYRDPRDYDRDYRDRDRDYRDYRDRDRDRDYYDRPPFDPRHPYDYPVGYGRAAPPPFDPYRLGAYPPYPPYPVDPYAAAAAAAAAAYPASPAGYPAPFDGRSPYDAAAGYTPGFPASPSGAGGVPAVSGGGGFGGLGVAGGGGAGAPPIRAVGSFTPGAGVGGATGGFDASQQYSRGGAGVGGAFGHGGAGVGAGYRQY